MPKFARFYLKEDEERTPHFGVVADEHGSVAPLKGAGSLVDVLSSEDGGEAAVVAALASKERLPAAAIQLLAPVPERECGAIFCVGMNYVDHCTEQGFPIPDEPIIFNKLPRCIRGPDDDMLINSIVPNLDFEVELAIVIGKTCRYVSEEEAPSVIAGYTVAHDVSARHWQLKKNGGQWFIGKTFESYAPIGPYLVPAGADFDPNNCKLGCTLNGASVQDSSTKEFIFNTHACVAWISTFVTLMPGDLIFTGTPPGVGCFRKPQLWLKAGDVVTCHVEGIGAITNKVVPDQEDPRERVGLLTKL